MSAVGGVKPPNNLFTLSPSTLTLFDRGHLNFSSPGRRMMKEITQERNYWPHQREKIVTGRSRLIPMPSACVGHKIALET